jgi:hypothetical protein
MLQSTQEYVTVSVPSVATNTDPHTRETLSGGAALTYSVPVVWVTAPRRELRLDQNQGVVHGVIQGGEAQLLYEPLGLDTDATWSAWIKPDVVVTRGGLDWTPYAIAEDPRHSRVVVSLRLREGGQ